MRACMQKWKPTPVSSVPPGTEEPGGLPSMGLHRVGHDESDLAAAAAFLKVSWKRSLELRHIVRLLNHIVCVSVRLGYRT